MGEPQGMKQVLQMRNDSKGVGLGPFHKFEFEKPDVVFL